MCCFATGPNFYALLCDLASVLDIVIQKFVQLEYHIAFQFSKHSTIFSEEFLTFFGLSKFGHFYIITSHFNDEKLECFELKLMLFMVLLTDNCSQNLT